MPSHIHDLIVARLTRRGLLKGAAATGAITIGGACTAQAEQADAFTEVVQGYDGAVHWPHQTHTLDLIVSWGDPLWSNAPAWEKGKTTSAGQALQFGDSNDFIAFMPLPKGSQSSDHGLLAVNHEFTRAATMFVDHDDPMEPDRVRAEMMGHGMSVVEVKRTEAGWGLIVDGTFNRRITLESPMTLTGPVAGHPRVQTPADPSGRVVLGTMANCAGGITPWGTALSGEENINLYWTGSAENAGAERAGYAAMGVGDRQVWHFSVVDPRFDLDHAPCEPNRFGWIVELDPYDLNSVPKKRTAMGRFFHEGAEVVLDGGGHVVVYMGDDTADEHLYRFVSESQFQKDQPDSNRDLLESGTLSVAVFSETDLRWVPLRHEGVLAEHFDSLADILIDTRMAAKLVGATPMDRPERVAVHPKSGRVAVMLTKNKKRTVPGPGNPRAGNLWGQILEIDPGAGGHTSERMTWTIMLEAGPREKAQVAPAPASTTKDGMMSCPDNCIYDRDGRLWVTSDGAPGAHIRMGNPPLADGLYVVDAEGAERGRSRLFLRACIGAELTGPCFTPDNSTLFVSVQHPGRAKSGEHMTSWPGPLDPAIPARSTVVALRRKRGGPIL
jgi:uncharacterized protein